MKMRRRCVLVILVSLITMSWARAAELKITWRGLDDGLVIELAPDEEAIIDIWVVLSDEDTLSTVFFFNEAAENISQAGVTTELPGWDTGGASGPLGGGIQQFAVAAGNPSEGSVDGPGEFLVGSQTVRLNGGSIGEELEIAVDTGQGFDVLAADGASYTLVATGSESQDLSGFVHVGSGSPGYTVGGVDDVRDPLIVRVIAGNGGGGDGNANDNSGGEVDSDGDGVPDDEDAFPDDSGETTDTDDDGVGDNADLDDDNDGVADEDDAFPDDPEETGDNDEDGVGDNADTDDDNDGVADEDDIAPLNPDIGQNTGGSSGGGRTSGPCGLGILGALPFGLAGLFLLHGQRRW